MTEATSKLQIQKRGRHPIEPELDRFIERESSANMRQLPEDRLPYRVLAHRIHESLVKENKGKKTARVPKESTIVKRVQQYSKEPDKLDGPWTVLTLRDFPIPAAALPTVLRVWVAMREAKGRNLTIREAQWVSRLYLAAKRMSFDYLVDVALMYAEDERVDTTTSLRSIRDQSLDLSLFEAVTGQKVDSKRATIIFGYREFDGELIERMLWGPNWQPTPELGETLGIREMLRIIGEQKNE